MLAFTGKFTLEASMRGLLIAGALVTLAAGNAHAQPPRTVQEAVAAGHAQAAKDLGGSAREVVEALTVRMKLRERTDAGQPQFEAAKRYFTTFADPSTADGFLFVTPDRTHRSFDGQTVTAAVARQNRDGSVDTILLLANGGAQPAFVRGAVEDVALPVEVRR